MTVVRYWDSISNKTKICKKETIDIFLDNIGSNYNTNDGLNEKMTLCLKSKSEKTTVVKWNEGMNI